MQAFRGGLLLWSLIILCSANSGNRMPLLDWNLINNMELPSTVGGSQISMPSFSISRWYNITVPGTVMASLQRVGEYPDPFYSLNLLNIPRVQFSFSWWYRTVFSLPVSPPSSHYVIRFEGINYRANIWVNGQQIANTSQIVGTFRYYDIPLSTNILSTSQENCIAVEVFRPYDSWTPPSNDLVDLAISWIDWAPFAPDGNTGLWRNVSLQALGATSVDIRYPSVSSKVLGDNATISFFVEAENYGSSAISGTMILDIAGVGIQKTQVTLQTGTAQQVFFPDIVLTGSQLRLWWPWQMGKQEFYEFSVQFEDSSGYASNLLQDRFGVREITSQLTPRGDRLFYINGKPILIRGGGWSSDLLLRYSFDRQRQEMKYIRDMGLNAIRMEGKLENDHFYSLADEYGILLMPGWACCDAWQHWSAWKDEQHFVAKESLRSEVKRTRIHPSLLVFLYSSDELPPVDVEEGYLEVFAQENWPNPTLNSAAKVDSSLTGPSGVKMSGPYVWEPPNYWLEDKNFKFGGAFGFLTEGGPGASPMLYQSLEKTIPADEMWPINFYWNYHCGNQRGLFGNLDYFTPPLDSRYGAASSAREYLFKAQVAAYESHRAMFEAYSRNKYTSTGLIHWMLNNPWPSNIWHMYDYYLNPGGSFFGIKKALTTLHAMFSYTDGSVWLINSLYEQFDSEVYVSADVYSLNATKLYSGKSGNITVSPDSSTEVLSLSMNWSGFFFVHLQVMNAQSDTRIEESFYWYNGVPDVLDWEDSNFYRTPCSSYADLTALASLPPINDLSLVYSVLSQTPENTTLAVSVTNPSNSIAFFVHLSVVDNNGEFITPILWEDNMLTLLPQTSTIVHVEFAPADNFSVEIELYNNVVNKATNLN